MVVFPSASLNSFLSLSVTYQVCWLPVSCHDKNPKVLLFPLHHQITDSILLILYPRCFLIYLLVFALIVIVLSVILPRTQTQGNDHFRVSSSK